MDRLFRHLGLSDERVSATRARMAAQLSAEFEAFVENALDWTMRVPGYEQLDREAVRPNTFRAMQTMRESLEGAGDRRFGAMFAEVALQRARQGLAPSALHSLVDGVEIDLLTLGSRCLDGPEERLIGALIARQLCDEARVVIFTAFQHAHDEARADLERLMQQFSAPVLPTLPGVLVMPIVGEVSRARAAKILDALLAGISRYGADVAILDITGITDVDATLADHLARANAATRLQGARLLLAGVQPKTAMMLVGGSNLAGIVFHATLADALRAVRSR